jgi:hypothetical protein
MLHPRRTGGTRGIPLHARNVETPLCCWPMRQLGRPQGLSKAQREQECGKSEGPAVMAGIGDEMIAPIRKDADVRMVAHR